MSDDGAQARMVARLADLISEWVFTADGHRPRQHGHQIPLSIDVRFDMNATYDLARRIAEHLPVETPSQAFLRAEGAAKLSEPAEKIIRRDRDG